MTVHNDLRLECDRLQARLREVEGFHRYQLDRANRAIDRAEQAESQLAEFREALAEIEEGEWLHDVEHLNSERAMDTPRQMALNALQGEVKPQGGTEPDELTQLRSQLAELREWCEDQKRAYRGTDGVDWNVRRILDAALDQLQRGAEGEASNPSSAALASSRSEANL